MNKLNLLTKCSVNTNIGVDTFVGIKFQNGKFTINFPLGFHLSDNEEALRSDIILLLNTIKTHTDKMESELYKDFMNYSQIDFPFQAFLYLIYDYLDRGYYNEYQYDYIKEKKGKINWNRTINTIKPVIQNNNAFYLNFIVQKNCTNENTLISLIHKYCVYESFKYLGWLFTEQLPEKPQIKFNYKYFKNILSNKLLSTFDDKDKLLFKNMIALIDYEGNNIHTSFTYGTNRFEYIWESMIDTVYGIKGKNDYFPKTHWYFIDGTTHINNHLIPDTIMLHNNNLFILDAKYYKFGYTKKPQDLPDSSSIHKQITYGEYAYQNHLSSGYIYNAFIMPFNSYDTHTNTNSSTKIIGEALSNWKSGDKKYEHVIGILLDTKKLMSSSLFENITKQEELARIIQSYFK